MQIAFQQTELFQIDIDAVIYTDQFTFYIGTWTRSEIRSYIEWRIRLNIDIASCTGISEGSVQTILKRLDLRKVCAR